MANVRQKDTGAEIALRRALFGLGLRYRVNFAVLEKPRRVADIVFPSRKIAIFVDGCFWHGCPKHASWPKRNSEFWRQKIEANRQRDADTNDRLRALGWKVIRFWEHESPAKAAETVANLIDAETDERHDTNHHNSGKNVVTGKRRRSPGKEK